MKQRIFLGRFFSKQKGAKCAHAKMETRNETLLKPRITTPIVMPRDAPKNIRDLIEKQGHVFLHITMDVQNLFGLCNQGILSHKFASRIGKKLPGGVHYDDFRENAVWVEKVDKHIDLIRNCQPALIISPVISRKVFVTTEYGSRVKNRIKPAEIIAIKLPFTKENQPEEIMVWVEKLKSFKKPIYDGWGKLVWPSI